MSIPQRIRIGLLFQHNENWIGGTYYILNLIHSLRTLPAAEQPEIHIISNQRKDFETVQTQTNYPHLQYLDTNISYNLPSRILNKILRPILGRNIIEKRPTVAQLDVVFPIMDTKVFFMQLVPHLIFWIPDFQEEYLPQFFSVEELEYRRWAHTWVAEHGKHLVVSSQAAANDFQKFYHFAQAKTYVVPFAVTHPPYQQLSIQNLLSNYQLPANYFFCPNQFWVHKNHRVVLEAVALLKQQGHSICIAFSGKEHDYRAPHYTDQIKEMVQTLQIQSNVHFLGFIDRADQLCLMKNAIAIVQPSLFEGWSTSVEDAKAMNQPVIASNLAVHIEQLGDKGHYFAPDDAETLAKILLDFQSKPKQVLGIDYSTSVHQFGHSFMQIIRQMMTN